MDYAEIHGEKCNLNKHDNDNYKTFQRCQKYCCCIKSEAKS